MRSDDEVDALRARLVDGPAPVTAGIAGSALVVSAHHGAVDGLGLFASWPRRRVRPGDVQGPWRRRAPDPRQVTRGPRSAGWRRRRSALPRGSPPPDGEVASGDVFAEIDRPGLVPHRRAGDRGRAGDPPAQRRRWQGHPAPRGRRRRGATRDPAPTTGSTTAAPCCGSATSRARPARRSSERCGTRRWSGPGPRVGSRRRRGCGRRCDCSPGGSARPCWCPTSAR